MPKKKNKYRQVMDFLTGKEKDVDFKNVMQNFCLLMAVILWINFCIFLC